jgi:hypothetical protein
LGGKNVLSEKSPSIIHPLLNTRYILYINRYMAQVFITSNIMIISLYLNRLLCSYHVLISIFRLFVQKDIQKWDSRIQIQIFTHTQKTWLDDLHFAKQFFFNVICLKDNDGFHTFFVAKNIQIVVFSRNTNYPVISISRNTLSRIFKRKANSLQTTM